MERRENKGKRGKIFKRYGWVFGIILLLGLGVVFSNEYPSVEFVVDFIGTIIIPESIDAGQKNVNYEFPWARINVTNVGQSSWMSLTWLNSSGPMRNTTFRVKDSAENVIQSHWYLDETLNLTNLKVDTYTIYAKGSEIGRLKAFFEVRCSYCNISQGNKYFELNESG